MYGYVMKHDGKSPNSKSKSYINKMLALQAHN